MNGDKTVAFAHLALRGVSALCELHGHHTASALLLFADHALNAATETGSLTFATAAISEFVRAIYRLMKSR